MSLISWVLVLISYSYQLDETMCCEQESLLFFFFFFFFELSIFGSYSCLCYTCNLNPIEHIETSPSQIDISNQGNVLGTQITTLTYLPWSEFTPTLYWILSFTSQMDDTYVANNNRNARFF